MDSELWGTIRRLYEVDKLSQRAISRRLGIHRISVRRALGSPEGAPVDAPRRPSAPGVLEPYVACLQERLHVYPDLSAQKLFLEIQRQGYPGSYTTIKRWVRAARPRPVKAYLRLETLPGEYAQVDWANCGTITIGNARRRLSCFVMVLSYSRLLYLEFTLSQCVEDFLAGHVNAFEFFGGIPTKINYDNLKAVVLSRVGQNIRFHPRFMDFAGYYLFEPVPCNVRAGWEKGKVESAIKFVRSAFLAGRAITSWPQIQTDASLWLREANSRVHGTTRERPQDRFEQEENLLQTLPPKPYDTAIVRSAPATRQALVHFDGNRYSVPWRWSGKTLTLKADAHQVHAYDGPRLLCTHNRCYERGRVIENPAHYDGLLSERKKARAAKRQDAFLALAPETEAYLQGLVQSELHVQSHLEKILDLVHAYGKTEVVGALAHALRFGAFGASYVQRIILQNRAARNLPAPEPIVLTKKPHWNRIAVEQPDLSLYDELFERKP